MPRFFTDDVDGSRAGITGGDAEHIIKALRMKPGERLTVCDGRGFDYECEIAGFTKDAVSLEVLSRKASQSEPSVRVTLYQGLPKSDKMEYIVQKSVELGVSRIVPVITGRSVSRPDAKSLSGKIKRWNKIAAEAAKQSGRGQLPAVADAMNFKNAAAALSRHETPLMLYEANGGGISGCIAPDSKDVGFFIGPEGGFEREEVEAARAAGVRTAGLGPRILRTETAPLCVLSVIMYITGNL